MSCNLKVRFTSGWTGITQTTYTADATVEGSGKDQTLTLKNVKAFSASEFFDGTDDLRSGAKNVLEGVRLKTSQSIECSDGKVADLNGHFAFNGSIFESK